MVQLSFSGDMLDVDFIGTLPSNPQQSSRLGYPILRFSESETRSESTSSALQYGFETAVYESGNIAFHSGILRCGFCDIFPYQIASLIRVAASHKKSTLINISPKQSVSVYRIEV